MNPAPKENTNRPNSLARHQQYNDDQNKKQTIRGRETSFQTKIAEIYLRETARDEPMKPEEREHWETGLYENRKTDRKLSTDKIDMMKDSANRIAFRMGQ